LGLEVGAGFASLGKILGKKIFQKKFGKYDAGRSVKNFWDLGLGT